MYILKYVNRSASLLLYHASSEQGFFDCFIHNFGSNSLILFIFSNRYCFYSHASLLSKLLKAIAKA